jgi:potassium-transporting ATPase KdpC subunit
MAQEARMIGITETPPCETAESPASPPMAGWSEQVRPALVGVLVLTAITGIAYPLALAGLSLPLFTQQADGSLLRDGDTIVGSALIGQEFTLPGYFHGRPSAAGAGYDGTASGGSNLSPANPTLYDAVGERAQTYRRANGLSRETPIPIDAVTASASGLDPHISPANAALQVARVARARGLSEVAVSVLVAEHTSGRQLGFLGEPRVAVLPLNLALDRLAPLPGAPPNR